MLYWYLSRSKTAVIGQDCTNAQCTQGAVCQGRVCKGVEGTECTIQSDCAVGHSCIGSAVTGGGICRRDGGLGTPCTPVTATEYVSTAARRCAYPLVCSSGICRSEGGGACRTNLDCVSGMCSNGVCATADVSRTVVDVNGTSVDRTVTDSYSSLFLPDVYRSSNFATSNYNRSVIHLSNGYMMVDGMRVNYPSGIDSVTYAVRSPCNDGKVAVITCNGDVYELSTINPSHVMLLSRNSRYLGVVNTSSNFVTGGNATSNFIPGSRASSNTRTTDSRAIGSNASDRCTFITSSNAGRYINDRNVDITYYDTVMGSVVVRDRGTTTHVDKASHVTGYSSCSTRHPPHSCDHKAYGSTGSSCNTCSGTMHTSNTSDSNFVTGGIATRRMY